SGTEDRVQEFSRVAHQREPRAVDAFYRTCKSIDPDWREDNLHAGKTRRGVWVAFNYCAKLSFRFSRKRAKEFRITDDTDAGAAVRERNNPNPRSTRMNANPDFSFLAVGGSMISAHMREQSIARRERRR